MSALTHNTLFEEELRKEVDQEIERLKEEMAAGALSFDQYNNYCGQVSALRAVETFCDTVRKKLSER